jgi:alkyl hydroperoxide reductase subunit D
MMTLEDLRALIPDPARDIKLNLQSVLAESVLSTGQRWGVAVAAAVASRNGHLRRAVMASARQEVPATVIDDAIAAATIMAMNNVYYRFRHLVGKPIYSDRPARLRMNRLVRPAGSQVDFELYSLAVSAINGCGTCLEAHEKAVTGGGLGVDHVHDAVRIAATIHAAAVSLDLLNDAEMEAIDDLPTARAL